MTDEMIKDTALASQETTVLGDRYAQAIVLDQQIKDSLHMAVQNTLIACNHIMEMKESGLYSELGYKDFDDYIEKRHGIKARQAYKYISIAKNIPDNFLSPGAKIGMSQLYLLSTLSKDEREKVVEETDIENVTKRELEQKVKELKLLRKDLEQSEAECDDLTKNCEQLKMDLNTAANDIGKLQKENDKLKRDVEELENRPIDVAVKDNDEELEQLREAVKKAEKEKANLDKKYKERMNELSELDKRHKAEVEKLSAEYEEKLKQAEKTTETAKPDTVSDPKEAFKAYYTIAYKAFSTLLAFAKEQPKDYKEFFLDKTSKLAESLKESVKGATGDGE